MHTFGLEDLHPTFVEPFESGTCRARLVERFLALVQRVRDLGVPFEVWLDGSFATKKPDPEDIDVLFVFDEDAGNASDPQVQQELLAIFAPDGRRETRIRYGCDVFFIGSHNADMRSYWRGWFGFTRDELPKGIPVIRVDP